MILQDIARVDINSPTLLCVQPQPTEFLFPTTSFDNAETAAAGFGSGRRYVVADVYLDRFGHLEPDTPYVPWRLENVGSDASLR